MSDVYSYLWLIPVLPLLGAVVITLFGPRFLKDQSHWPCVLAIAASAVLSFGVLYNVYTDNMPKDAKGEVKTSQTYYTWFEIPPGESTPDQVHIKVDVSFRADALSAIMLTTVTFIGTLIAIFAIGYMHGDPGYPRFFAAVSLFIFAMTLLVSGNNFVMLFAGWEGVGLCSYLLIGFWFGKPSAADAALKAFIVNRIGDFGFILGILLLWVNAGYALDYDTAFTRLPEKFASGEITTGVMTAICLLLLCGAIGKSAQFPLHVWLPDAMEGPTPVSALIHAATMVTAGVYLVARCTPLFSLAPDAQLVVGCIGGFTALLAALIALTQNDLKRVLAYSTLSQLGYMFLALGCALRGGEPSLVNFAVFAAIFHLFTHAFFKALLFLSAGSVMHAMGGVIDMRRFSGLRKVLPVTHATFLVGAVALAGIPPLAGFWSKDEILGVAFGASQQSENYKLIYFLLFVSGVFTAGLTAFYTGRAYFMTFWGPKKLPPEAGQHGHHDAHTPTGHDSHGAHGSSGHAAPASESHGHAPVDESKLESPPVMTIPLIILAVFAFGVGMAVGPTEYFAKFVERTQYFLEEASEYKPDHLVMGVSILIAGLGAIGAWFLYIRRTDLPGKLAASFQSAYQLSLNKFFFDELYSKMVRQVRGFAEFCRTFDSEVIDNMVDLVGEMPRLIGSLFRPVQNGLVQFYALAMMLGLTVFLIALVRSL
jgi:NADH-quinone oxidoreductase subunit L